MGYIQSSSIYGVAIHLDGNLYASRPALRNIKKFFTDGTSADWGTGYSWPTQLAIDSSGNLYVSDNTTVKMVDADNVTSVIYSVSPFPGANSFPITVDPDSDRLYIVELTSSRLIICYGTPMCTWSYNVSLPVVTGLRWIVSDGLWTANNLYMVFPSNGTNGVHKYNLDTGTFSKMATGFGWPNGICLNRNTGSVYVSDYLSINLHLVTPGDAID